MAACLFRADEALEREALWSRGSDRVSAARLKSWTRPAQKAARAKLAL